MSGNRKPTVKINTVDDSLRSSLLNMGLTFAFEPLTLILSALLGLPKPTFVAWASRRMMRLQSNHISDVKAADLIATYLIWQSSTTA